jgi:hypothetical protein
LHFVVETDLARLQNPFCNRFVVGRRQNAKKHFTFFCFLYFAVEMNSRETTRSVATKIFREIAQFRGHGGLPRPEGPRQSLRSGSRSDSFWGSGQGGCTEMHYSPRIWPERDPELRLIFLSLSPPAASWPPVAGCLRSTTDSLRLSCRVG